MSDINHLVTFRHLLEQCPRIEIPLIQRDYAQGREAEKEVRDDFLKALHGALLLSPQDSTLPLNLDFVYGSLEDGDPRAFLPLDGQQRLTTLFLLHWYLAWSDGEHAQLEAMLWDGKRSRFTYSVRPSSTEFFDELVRFVPSAKPEQVLSLRATVENQPWFFLHWRLDPTIQSVLVMLDSIHQLFKQETSLFSRLVDTERPAITFQLLPLKHFGLTDDLYIKMNARGKPLTPFETFKARLEEHLKELFPIETRELGGSRVRVAEFFERRIDTQWTDFFWAHKDPKSHTFDDLAMNLLRAVACVSLEPENKRFNQDTTLLRESVAAASFSQFHEHGWLTREFASNVICLLESWSSGDDHRLSPILPDSRYFDEAVIFARAIKGPTALSYTDLTQFAAFVFYLRYHEGSVQPVELSEWMRVVRNLAANSEIERPDEYGRCLASLRKLVPHGAQILERLADTDLGLVGFSHQQVREEVLKARLILANPEWRARIDNAEAHGYLSGQIEFLLDYCGALAHSKETPTTWDAATHTVLQGAFDVYLSKAHVTFTSSGLARTKNDDPTLWKRALLAIGDYLIPFVANYSFLTDPPGSGGSWKRFLRGDAGKRQHLKTLWDRLDAASDIEPQLVGVIAAASNLEPWRSAIVEHPEVISYCTQQEIRRSENAERIYLLRKKQMNGNHAELFSFVLHLELRDREALHSLKPLSLQGYRSVTMTEIEPHVCLDFVRSGRSVSFSIESTHDHFLIRTRSAELTTLPEVEAVLRTEAEFSEGDGELTRQVPRDDIYAVLQSVAGTLAGLPA